MVMQVQPLRDAVLAAKKKLAQKPIKTVYLSPQGRHLKQEHLKEWAKQKITLLLISGRYSGVDERFIQANVDEECSLGDFILSGGEIATLAIIDAVARLLPGTLGNEQSAGEDSFMQGLLAYPHYTRPREIDGQIVPEVLLSGSHASIERWRLQQALGNTWRKRPDLLAKRTLSADEQDLLDEFRGKPR